MEIATTISDARIAGLLCSGFEGGMTGQWCRIMRTRKPTEIRPVLDAGCTWGKPQVAPYYDYPLLPGGATICRLDDGCAPDTDKRYTPLVLDRAAVERGLATMAAKYPRHYADFVSENDDAITGDVFIQCCLLGEIVYG